MKKGILLTLGLAVSACGATMDGPSEEAITNALKLEVPAGLDIEGIEVQASQNVGDQIEPNWRSRSNLSVVLSDDFAIENGSIGGRPLIRLVAQEGTRLSGEVFTTGRPIGDGWSVTIEDVRLPQLAGRPVSAFNDPILIGSPEEEEARQQILEERAADAEAAARNASELADQNMREALDAVAQ